MLIRWLLVILLSLVWGCSQGEDDHAKTHPNNPTPTKTTVQIPPALKVTVQKPEVAPTQHQPEVKEILYIMSTLEFQGQTLARKCKVCHDFSYDRNVRVGPPLRGVVGRKAGQEKKFKDERKFSTAMMDSGIVWDEINLLSFLENPKGMFTGKIKMSYPGIKNPQEREAIVAYLKYLGTLP